MKAYRDPTAERATGNITCAERRIRRMHWPGVYICSPYAGDVATNVANAKRYCRFAIRKGCDPFAPHLFYTRFLTDDHLIERKIGMELGLRKIGQCSELWVFGEVISSGMEHEIRFAKRYGVSIRYFTNDCEEVIAT